MPTPFVGEIRLFPFGYAPPGWAPCAGQLLPIRGSNTALFAIIGNRYGGNGKNTFALPDLSGRVAMGAGDGPGLTPRYVGEDAGEDVVKLEVEQLAPHTHMVQGSPFPAQETGPTPSGVPARSVDGNAYGPFEESMTEMAPQVVGSQGGGDAHPNLMPSLGMTYCIALVGTFPRRPDGS
jgi:microcystin-dependent protein